MTFSQFVSNLEQIGIKLPKDKSKVHDFVSRHLSTYLVAFREYMKVLERTHLSLDC